MKWGKLLTTGLLEFVAKSCLQGNSFMRSLMALKPHLFVSISAGVPLMIVIEFMSNGSLDNFLKVCNLYVTILKNGLNGPLKCKRRVKFSRAVDGGRRER